MPDYSSLPPQARQKILNGLFAALARPIPRDQLSRVLALTFGLMGLQPTGLSLDQLDEDTAARRALDVVCDAAADAALEVLARHGAMFKDGR